MDKTKDERPRCGCGCGGMSYKAPDEFNTNSYHYSINKMSNLNTICADVAILLLQQM